MAADEALELVGLRRGATTSRRSSRAASSSAWRSPAPSPSGPTCCSATSRPARSTSQTGMLVLEAIERVNRELGRPRRRDHAQRGHRRHGRPRGLLWPTAASSSIERERERACAARSSRGERMRPLDRKLLRDLWRMRGQALAIALVVGAGVALLRHAARRTFDSLDLDRSTRYYRALSLRRRLRLRSSARRTRSPSDDRARSPASAESRPASSRTCALDVPGMAEPAVGRLISLAAHGPPRLERVLPAPRPLAGAGPAPTRCCVGEAFAARTTSSRATRSAAVINGRRAALRIVGIALSPEYVYAIRAGELLPDDRRFGVIWMSREALGRGLRHGGRVQRRGAEARARRLGGRR